jgi:hypothetical protein
MLKTNKCTYTLYIISLFTKTLKSPTCFGPKDHPQGAHPVPSWLLKFKISRKTLVKKVWQHICKRNIRNNTWFIIHHISKHHMGMSISESIRAYPV